MSKTWILAANRVRARLFELDESQDAFSEIEDFTNPEGRAPAGSRGENRPPRVFDSTGNARHAIEPRTEPVIKFAERFARRMTATLEDARNHQRFDRLVLVAPPRFLGHLRRCMPAQLYECVTREIGKDMTQDTPETIREAGTEPFRDAR